MKKAVLLPLLLFLLFLAGCVQDWQETGEADSVQVPAGAPLPPEAAEPVIADAEGDILVAEPSGVKDKYSQAESPHWTHMPVTYFIVNEKECGKYEANKIKRGFDDITNATNGVVNFKKVNESASAGIDIRCSFIKDCYELKTDIQADVVIRYEIICAHELGFAQITEYEGNHILKASIEFVGLDGFSETSGRGASGFYIGSCGHPTTEIHEILHAFGYGHSNDSRSIMYYAEDAVGTVIQEEGACLGKRREIDAEIIESLLSTYG